MLVNKRTLQEIFDPTGRFEAPMFQRPYVWNEADNWIPLWESISKAAERRLSNSRENVSHFLGTVVLDQSRTPTGSVPCRYIIDGQQRLTTLQIMLASVRDACASWSELPYQRVFDRLTKNDTPLSEDEDDQFKIWPTNVDQPVFRQVMLAHSSDEVCELAVKYPQSLLPKAYEYFRNTISEWLVHPSDVNFKSKIASLHRAVCEDLNIVVIDLGPLDDAQVIFETLNALGTPLLPADLVKNFLFHKARTEGEDTDAIYSEYWKQFDEDQAFWRKEISRGRLKIPQIDVFLQYYLTLTKGEDVSSSQLFTTFRRYVYDQKELKAVDHIKRFKEYAMIYRSFMEYDSISREGVFFKRIAAFETSTLYPIILEIFRRYSGEINRGNRVQILVDFESFIVRRTLCGLTSKSYNRFFADMIRKRREEDDFSPQAIRQALLDQTSEASRWPIDNEFLEAWITLKMYKRMPKFRLNAILLALNQELWKSKNEIFQISGSLTIEHLMPQKWQKHWPLATSRNTQLGLQPISEVEAEEYREEFLHTIGNLTLLTEELNSSVSNGPWSVKKHEILKHSALNINRSLIDITEWDELQIIKRSCELFAIARSVWPRPSKA